MYKAKPILYLHFDTLSSTNTWVKEHVAFLDPEGLTCVTALEQTQGRGRLGRRWVSPRGQNIYATFYFSIEQNAPHLLNLGQVLSVSCARLLRRLGCPVEIKWPNDLLLEQKKVAGILCETVVLSDRVGIALGVGINIYMSSQELVTIDQPATSLAEYSGTLWDRALLIQALSQEFAADLTQLERGGFLWFQEEYINLLAFTGRRVLSEEGALGILEGVDEKGRLLLRLQEGSTRALYASSLRLMD